MFVEREPKLAQSQGGVGGRGQVLRDHDVRRRSPVERAPCHGAAGSTEARPRRRCVARAERRRRLVRKRPPTPPPSVPSAAAPHRALRPRGLSLPARPPDNSSPCPGPRSHVAQDLDCDERDPPSSGGGPSAGTPVRLAHAPLSSVAEWKLRSFRTSSTEGGCRQSSGRSFEKVAPATGELLCRAARSDATDAAAAVGAARSAQASWAARTPVERGELVREIALALRARRDEAAELVAAETGKAPELARGEADAAVEMGFFVAGEGRRLYGRTTTSAMPNRTVLATRRPVGVAALIVSFNTPLPNLRVEGLSRRLLWQRGRSEAVRAHPGLGRVLRRDLSGAPARRRTQRRARSR